MRLTTILQFSVLAILSCTAITNAYADIIASDGAVIVTGNRSLNEDNRSRALYRSDDFRGRNDVIIYNRGVRNNGALIVKDGKVIDAQNGEHDLGNGSKINVIDGRVNGRVGNVDIKN